MRAHYALLVICVFIPLTVLADANDTTAPVIYALVPSTTQIWPPDHKMVPISINTLVLDDTDPAPIVVITGVTSNDPDAEAEDIEITGPLSVNLRADKTRNEVRIYTIMVEAIDGSGNVSESTTQVRVEHARRDPGF
jgi:hypothetical protein